jgi:hypothetical protein
VWKAKACPTEPPPLHSMQGSRGPSPDSDRRFAREAEAGYRLRVQPSARAPTRRLPPFPATAGLRFRAGPGGEEWPGRSAEGATGAAGYRFRSKQHSGSDGSFVREAAARATVATLLLVVRCASGGASPGDASFHRRGRLRENRGGV